LRRMWNGWETIESGPGTAERTILLLPGGMCNARMWTEVMAQPSLAGYRLVAATMPGHSGAPAPDDFRPEYYGEITAELARDVEADVVVGFSMGAMVTYEMAVSGAFTGPIILLGSSFCSADEPGFFRGIAHSTRVLGTLPMSLLKAGAGSMVKQASVSPERQAELKEDFKRNNSADMAKGLRAYMHWLAADDGRAERLCKAGLPTWVVHAEKGDGALTAQERSTLEACPNVHVVTIPGHVFFLPNDVPDQIAALIVEALAAQS
jgi:pimeloyl-ACP methyl ester carboxylesterase